MVNESSIYAWWKQRSAKGIVSLKASKRDPYNFIKKLNIAARESVKLDLYVCSHNHQAVACHTTQYRDHLAIIGTRILLFSSFFFFGLFHLLWKWTKQIVAVFWILLLIEKSTSKYDKFSGTGLMRPQFLDICINACMQNGFFYLASKQMQNHIMNLASCFAAINFLYLDQFKFH